MKLAFLSIILASEWDVVTPAITIITTITRVITIAATARISRPSSWLYFYSLCSR
jgi:hypothetical protein